MFSWYKFHLFDVDNVLSLLQEFEDSLKIVHLFFVCVGVSFVVISYLYTFTSYNEYYFRMFSLVLYDKK